MKLYDSIGPNPKMVRMFAAEKGFSFKETQKVDIMKGENRQAPYLAKNPAGGMPSVELDGGKIISETIAICELIEETKPQPALIGTSPSERAETRMWVRRVEWKIIQPMTDGFRFAEGLPLFKTRMYTAPEAAPGLKAIAQEGFKWLDAQLAGRDTIVPGRFSLADVALYALAEFGSTVGQTIPAECKNVQRWYEATKARPSAKA
ncbi:MAG TPA: glutathione S-transferase N-terminal domain-containing protein [Myxococcota bacterium]|nr:glutathione S-transferase N-terminal domain-containing protein [Myxococcota bacterium]